MEYLDSLYMYSEFLGIEEDHVKIYNRDNEQIVNTKSNRDNIINQHVQGFRPGNEIYDFIKRDRAVNPTFEDWVVAKKNLDFAGFLRSWQQEVLQEQVN